MDCKNVLAETVVAESVVVIKKLLQTQPSQHSEIIKHMARLFDNITVCFTISFPPNSHSLLINRKCQKNIYSRK